MLSLILSRVEDKDEDFKKNRRHIAICHVVFTIIDLMLLTIYYNFQVSGFNPYKGEFLAFVISGFLAFQIGYVTAACTDLWKNQKMDKSGYEKI